jgi:hypothetical protein
MSLIVDFVAQEVVAYAVVVAVDSGAAVMVDVPEVIVIVEGT